MTANKKKTKSTNVLEGTVTEISVEPLSRHHIVKCPACRRVTDAEKLAENLDVCPRCGHPMRLGARRRLAMTVDAGSFEEMDPALKGKDFLHFPGYEEKLQSARMLTGQNDAVLTGIASIKGHSCAIFVMNGEFMMGSMGAVVGEKLCRLFEHASSAQLPVVGFTVSGGARMQEGTTSLMQMAKVSAAVRRHRDQGLAYFVVLTDPTSGGVTASFAMEASITLAEPQALVAFAGPRVVEQTTHKRLPQGFQQSEFLLEHGFVDRIVERRDIPETLGQLLSLHVAQPRAKRGTSRDEGSVHDDVYDECSASVLCSSSALREALPDAFELLGRVRAGERFSVNELINSVFDGFLELHGDRLFGDDSAIVGGIAWLQGRPVTVIGTERGKDTKERVARNFGSAHPEGYRKTQRLMREAERFGRPVICLVDTSGAYCGIGAEERGQGEAIATNLMLMSGLKVPIISVIVGEGGSGGALALAAANRVFMLSGAVYSVVSPEGAASILWKDTSRAAEAARALRITAPDLLELGIIDGIIDDAELGSEAFIRRFKAVITHELEMLSSLSTDELLDQRYMRFRRMGGDALCLES